MDLIEKTIKSEQIYDGKVVNLWLDTVILPDGKEATREIIKHPGGVCVLASDENNHVYMVRQHRIPTGELLFEIPAGKLEYGEDICSAGRRELEEEAGVIAGDMIYMGYFYPTPAYCCEKIHMYFTKVASVCRQHLDDDEFLEVTKVPYDELYKMVMNNEITDGKTALAILKAKELINRQ